MDTDFTRIEPEHGRFRFYRLVLWPDLFGGVSVVREWGRLGQPGTLRVETYAGQAEAEKAFEPHRRRRLRRGYREAV